MGECEICAVCQEQIPNMEESMMWPSCHHKLHTTCALQLAQYDVRCPVCRCSSVPRRQSHFVLRLREALTTLFDDDLHVRGHAVPGNHHIFVLDPSQPDVAFPPRPPAVASDAPADANPNVETTAVTEALTEVSTSPHLVEQEVARIRRQYMQRRRCVLRGDTRLSDVDKRRRDNEREMTRLDKDLVRRWSQVQRDAWRDDDELKGLRKQYNLARNRFNRARRIVEDRVTQVIGPPPEMHIVLQDDDDGGAA